MVIEGTYLSIIKAIYDKHIANLILKVEKVKAFPLRSGTRQVCPLLPFLLSILLEVLHAAIREEKETQTGKREVKLSLFIDDIILYIEKPKDATRKFLGLINEFGKVAGYKINIQIPVAFLCTTKKL